MKLYYTRSACSLVPRIIINELALPCDYESVDLATKKTETGEDFLKINPKGAVPTLMISPGEVLTENAVILQYLADKAKADNLLPAIGNLKRYHVLEWVNYVATELHKGIGVLFNAKLPAEIKETVFFPLIRSRLDYVNKHLASNPYLLGDEFSLPDAYLFVMITWAIHFKFDIKEWANIHRYFKELLICEAIQKSLSQEKLQFSV